MQFLRKQMASTLTEAARNGLKSLDKNSPIVRELKSVDIDTVIEHDINKICQAVTFSEMSKIMSFAVKAKAIKGYGERMKEDLKKTARAIVERIESEGGKLMVPESYRELLFSL